MRKKHKFKHSLTVLSFCQIVFREAENAPNATAAPSQAKHENSRCSPDSRLGCGQKTPSISNPTRRP